MGDEFKEITLKLSRRDDAELFLFLSKFLDSKKGCTTKFGIGHFLVIITISNQRDELREWMRVLREKIADNHNKLLTKAYIKEENMRKASRFADSTGVFLNTLTEEILDRPLGKMNVIVKIPEYFYNAWIRLFVQVAMKGEELRVQEEDTWAISIPIPLLEKDKPIWMEVLREHSRNYCLGLEEEDLEKFQNSINALFEALAQIQLEQKTTV